jgi:hypothetical protein
MVKILDEGSKARVTRGGQTVVEMVLLMDRPQSRASLLA